MLSVLSIPILLPSPIDLAPAQRASMSRHTPAAWPCICSSLCLGFPPPLTPKGSCPCLFQAFPKKLASWWGLSLTALSKNKKQKSIICIPYPLSVLLFADHLPPSNILYYTFILFGAFFFPSKCQPHELHFCLPLLYSQNQQHCLACCRQSTHIK